MSFRIFLFCTISLVLSAAKATDLQQLTGAKEIMQERTEEALALKQKVVDTFRAGPAITHSVATLEHINCLALIDEAQRDPMPFIKLANSVKAVLDVRIKYLQALNQACHGINAIKQIGVRPSAETIERQTKASAAAEQRMTELLRQSIQQLNELMMKVENEKK